MERLGNRIPKFKFDMRKILVFFILLGFGAAIFVYVVQQTGIANIASTIARVTLLQILLYFVISLANFGVYTFRWWLILRSHGHEVPFWGLFFYRMVGYSVSYLTPVAQVGGEPFRVYFLNEKHKISLKESTSSVVIDKVFEISALLFFIGCGVVYVLLKGFFPPKMEFVLLVIMAVSVLLLFLFYRKTLDGTGFFSSVFRFLRLGKIKKIAYLEEKIVHTEHFISRFFQNSSSYILPLCVGLSILAVATIILEHWLLAYFLGLHLSFSQVFLISTLPSIAYIVPIPGGFGLLEGGHSTAFLLLGYSSVFAISLVLLIRIRDFFFVLIGLLYATHHGLWMFTGSERGKELRRMMKE